jgi:uncharacterized membrane protein
VITDGFDFIAVMLGLCAGLVLLERHFRWRLFRWFPSIVLVMFGSMTLYTVGAWEMTEEIRAARATVRDNLIPAMLFLMSLRFNLGVMRKLGPRLIVLSLVSTLTVMIGFVVVHEIMSPLLGDETPLTFATMSAGWTGGTQNFVAVKEALSVTDAAMTYTLLMGALCYTIWLVFIIALKPYRDHMAGFLRATDNAMDTLADEFAGLETGSVPDTQSLLIMLGLSLVVASLSHFAGDRLAALGVFNVMIWAIILSSVLGMIGAHTSLARLAGSDEVSGIMLYLVVALIGAEVSLGAIRDAPLYILSGFMILAVHGVLLLLAARWLRVDLYLVGIASIASIGSAPSAAVVGAAYGRNLVPVAIVMALIGSMLGSFVGLSVAEILTWSAAR